MADKQPKPDRKQEREQRAAEALRANLRRRKQKPEKQRDSGPEMREDEKSR